MKSILIAATFLLTALATCNSQTILQEIFPRKEAKNVVVGSAGTVIVVNGVNLAYERKLVTFKKQAVSSIWIKGRYTKFSGRVNQGGKSFFDISAMALLGSRRSYTEVGAGIGLFPAQSAVYPTGSVGYRYQRGRGGVIFRTGIGFPDIFYVGVGYGF